MAVLTHPFPITPTNRSHRRSLQVIDALHDEVDLPFRQVAQMLGVNESTLHRWRSGESAPRPSHERVLRDLYEFVTEYREMFCGTQQDGQEWLSDTLPSLDERTPLSLLLEGRIARVTTILGRANRGEPA